jgi:transcriptional regulator with XRE-family HTH domain
MYVERINLMCALTGISQSKLASELGISKQALNNYINKKNQFSEIVRLGILNYFDLPPKVFEQHEIHLVLKKNKLIVL